ncbi:hypothetical protein VMCG_00487 [Cytospora schulzeri]|uniref:Peroxisomal adenine nucleotide transporter 1 n=1 Tax=Cytospora schulzeri TaxID=448051 RepID=A0A423X9J0_9PEZI|nr:hypothetical protein VMCG_00487 [Valsa malicola]
MPADSFLPAIGHAVSGAAGTAISTTTTYPLDLVNTRLKVQRQLRRDGTIPPSEQYHGVADALARTAREQDGGGGGGGGLGALYAGLGSDVAKGVADSFLFFLFYAWFRSRRSGGSSGKGRQLPAWEELAVGAAAGACARLFTTPIGNVVTRKQTASLVRSGDGDHQKAGRPPPNLSVGEILHAIRAEKGILGLWAGYSATIVLTLNPSITFYLQNVLKKLLVDSGREGNSSGATFLIAAVSKVIATAVTYPFQIAKAISQVSAPESTKPEQAREDIKEPKSIAKVLSRHIHRLAGESIFATVYKMGKTEGIPALYDGLGGELLKAFLNHGTTMLSKDLVHRLVVKLYFFILAFIQRSPAAQALLRRRLGENLRRFGKVQIAEKVARVKDGYLALNLLERTQNLIVTR